MEHLSLAKLLKQSAMQLCYERKNKIVKPATEAQIKGNEMAHKKSESKFIEMRGTYSFKDMLIHYAFDEVQIEDETAKLIEHKNITSGTAIEEWYFNSAILQTATYQAFANTNPNKMLQTATFFIEQGMPMMELDLTNLYLTSELRMDNMQYEVLLKESKKIVDFYCYKAQCSFDYNLARVFDDKYKFKEYNYLKDLITIKPMITNHEEVF